MLWQVSAKELRVEELPPVNPGGPDQVSAKELRGYYCNIGYRGPAWQVSAKELRVKVTTLNHAPPLQVSAKELRALEVVFLHDVSWGASIKYPPRN